MAIVDILINFLPQSLHGTAYFLYNQLSSVPHLGDAVPWVIALIAGYFVLTMLLSTVRYAYRIFVFVSKIAAVIGVIASLMGASGQGGIGQLWNTVSPWLGLGDAQNANHGIANNLAAAANFFTGGNNNGGGGGDWWRNFIPSDSATPSSRTRSRAKRASKNAGYNPRGVNEDTPNPLADAFNNAADSDYVQGWVKSALGKVWEQATAGSQQEDKKKKSSWL